MAQRVVAALLDLGGQYRGRRVLVVTHGGPIRAMRAACGDDSAAQPAAGNGEVEEIVVRDGYMRRIHSTCGGLHEQVQG
jgi:broad specificity phosphatase PhoE